MKRALYRLHWLVQRSWRTLGALPALLRSLLEPEEQEGRGALVARSLHLPGHVLRFAWGLFGPDGDQRVLMRGKLRRHLLVYLRPGKVERMLGRRRGECVRCGVSCRLGFRCNHLTADSGLCGVQTHKPRICSAFPLDERDLRDRIFVGAKVACGYYFVRPGESEEEARRRSVAMLHPEEKVGR